MPSSGVDELSAAVDRIRRNLDGGNATAPAPENPSENKTEAAPSPRLMLQLLAGAVPIAGLVFLFRREAGPEITKPTDPTSLAEARLHASKVGGPASKVRDPASAQLLVMMKAWYVSSDGMLRFLRLLHSASTSRIPTAA